MKAVIETGGKQYYVEEGTVLYVEKLDVEPSKEVVFDKVLMVNGVPGNPYLENIQVKGTVIKHGKQKKIIKKVKLKFLPHTLLISHYAKSKKPTQ